MLTDLIIPSEKDWNKAEGLIHYHILISVKKGAHKPNVVSHHFQQNPSIQKFLHRRMFWLLTEGAFTVWFPKDS